MNRSAPPSRISLLLFSVGPFRFGIDSEEAEQVSTFDGEAADDLFWFHEEVGFGGAAPPYRMPTVVTVKTPESSSFRIVIDAMEEIAEFSSRDIHPFPPLLEPFALQKGMWGVLPRKGEMVLLVELGRLWRKKHDPASTGIGFNVDMQGRLS